MLRTHTSRSYLRRGNSKDHERPCRVNGFCECSSQHATCVGVVVNGEFAVKEEVERDPGSGPAWMTRDSTRLTSVFAVTFKLKKVSLWSRAAATRWDVFGSMTVVPHLARRIAPDGGFTLVRKDTNRRQFQIANYEASKTDPGQVEELAEIADALL